MNTDTNDILYQAASVWKELTEYQYIFTFGCKKRLYTIHLLFSHNDFPHLAGFQYLKDISFPKYNPRKIIDKIIDGKITYQQIQKGKQFENSVKPRLDALVQLKDIIEKDFTLFSYIPHRYPFTTTIKADYLLSSHHDLKSFIFLIHSTTDKTVKCNYLCCSAFTKGIRDYETNQRSLTILKKERIHIDTQNTVILYDRLTIS